MENKRKHIIGLILAIVLTTTLFNCLSFVAFSQEQYPREESIIFAIDPVAAYDNWNQYSVSFENWGTGWPLVAEPLFWHQVDNGSIIPILATGYEMSSDAKNWTIRIRNDVYWNDGKKWGMDDILYTFEALRQYPGLRLHGWCVKTIEKVEKIDDLTFKIVLKEPNAHFMSEIAQNVYGVGSELYILPKHVYEKYADPSTCENKEHVWTGPYNLTRCESNLFIWTRREDYWGINAHGWYPKPKYLIFKVVGTTEEALMALSRGEIDNLYHEGGWWSTYLTVKQQNPNVTLWYAPDFCQDDLFFNLHKYPFNLKEFRWAISYAINRSQFVEIFGEGVMGTVSKGPFSVPALARWMPEDLQTKYPFTYNLTKMEELLTSIGFTKDADGFWHDANGTLCEYELRHPDWQREFARLLGEQLTKAGIKTIVREASWTVYWTDVEKGYVTGEMIYGWAGAGMGCAAYDPYEFYKTMYSPFALPLGEVGGINKLRFKNETFDELFEQFLLTPLDSPDIEELNHAMYEIYLDELPMVPIWDKPDCMICNTKYWKNWPVSPPVEQSYARPAVFWYWMFTYILFNLEPTGLKTAPQVEPWIYATVAGAVIVVGASIGYIVYRRRTKKP
jgi:peptide/nickel transport system substrate-binding protein